MNQLSQTKSNHLVLIVCIWIYAAHIQVVVADSGKQQLHVFLLCCELEVKAKLGRNYMYEAIANVRPE